MSISKIIILFAASLMVAACQMGNSSNGQPAAEQKDTSNICTDNIITDVFVLEKDLQIFEDAILPYENMGYDNTPLSKIIIAVGNHFKGTPYVASTLETEGEEMLVVNLRGMDCTTFVEYVLAISFSLQMKQTSFGDFTSVLACLRYREGIIYGYSSRLNYFTEWMINNEQKGFIKILEDLPAMTSLNKKIDFMSGNAHLYRQLDNPAQIDSIKLTEEFLSGKTLNWIPKNYIEEAEKEIQDGDIIAFTTSIEGLDVSHTGFALFQNGRLHLLHASTRTNQVEISPIPLYDYLKPMNKVSGILVARVIE